MRGPPNLMAIRNFFFFLAPAILNYCLKRKKEILFITTSTSWSSLHYNEVHIDGENYIIIQFLITSIKCLVSYAYVSREILLAA